MDYIKDFCEQVDCPEHPNRHSNGDDALIFCRPGRVIVSIHGIKVSLACAICSNKKPIDMKKLMKTDAAKKELTK